MDNDDIYVIRYNGYVQMTFPTRQEADKHADRLNRDIKGNLFGRTTKFEEGVRFVVVKESPSNSEREFALEEQKE